MRILRLAARLRAFPSARRAAAAVEFAIILPVALLLYAGAAEVGDGVMTSRKVSVVTRTLVDLSSQQGTSTQSTSTPSPPNAVSATTLSTMLTAAATLLTPKPTTTLTMTVSAIDVRNNSSGVCCVATVRWSYTQGGTLRPCNINLTAGTDPASTTQVPAPLMPSGIALPQPLAFLVSDVSYTYQPLLGQTLFAFAPPMQRTEFMMPRSPGQVTTGALPASGTQHGQVCY